MEIILTEEKIAENYQQAQAIFAEFEGREILINGLSYRLVQLRTPEEVAPNDLGLLIWITKIYGRHRNNQKLSMAPWQFEQICADQPEEIKNPPTVFHLDVFAGTCLHPFQTEWAINDPMDVLEKANMAINQLAKTESDLRLARLWVFKGGREFEIASTNLKRGGRKVWTRRCLVKLLKYLAA